MGTEKKENLEEMFDRLDQVIGTLKERMFHWRRRLGCTIRE